MSGAVGHCHGRRTFILQKRNFSINLITFFFVYVWSVEAYLWNQAARTLRVVPVTMPQSVLTIVQSPRLAPALCYYKINVVNRYKSTITIVTSNVSSILHLRTYNLQINYLYIKPLFIHIYYLRRHIWRTYI